MRKSYANWLISFGRATVPNNIQAPVLSYEEIRRRADDFLATYHPSRKPPVPIEEIIEFRLRINRHYQGL
jgi:hypothetical protein